MPDETTETEDKYERGERIREQRDAVRDAREQAREDRQEARDAKREEREARMEDGALKLLTAITTLVMTANQMVGERPSKGKKGGKRR